MSLALAIDNVGCRLDLRNVQLSLLLWAGLVLRANEKCHGHLLDLGDINKGCFCIAFKPDIVKFLETISEAIHEPVLLRFDGLTLTASDAGEVIADCTRPIFAYDW